MFNKLSLIREFGLGVVMTFFLCIAPQDSPFWIGAVFILMFTMYETFPDFQWIPSWTAYKIVAKEEEVLPGLVRIAVQFVAAILGGIVGYQLLKVDLAVRYPMWAHEDDWRSLVWVAFVWAVWLMITNHNDAQKDGFRRNLSLTAVFCALNYILQGVSGDCILNSATNFGRLVGAKIYFDNHDNSAVEVNFDQLWILLLGPAIGVVAGWVLKMADDSIAKWDAPDADNQQTNAVYGSTGNDGTGAGSIALANADENAANADDSKA